MSSRGIRIPASRAASTSACAHRVGVVVRRPVGLVVQVVELADGGDPGAAHLAVRRQGERRSRSPGRAAPATAYICSRQVQNVPLPRWVRPRSARWNAWLWQFASPGSVRPGRAARGASQRESADGGPARVGESGVDAGEPAVLDLDQDVVADGAVDQRALEQVRRSSGQPLEGVGERLDAGEAVGRLGVLRRASARRRSGCGRTASRSGSRRRPGCRRRGRPGSG